MVPPPLECAASPPAGRWKPKSAESRRQKRPAESAGLLSRRGGNVPAVDSQDSTRRLACERKTDERLRNVLGQDLAAKKIAGEIVVLAHSARLRAFLDQGI